MFQYHLFYNGTRPANVFLRSWQEMLLFKILMYEYDKYMSGFRTGASQRRGNRSKLPQLYAEIFKFSWKRINGDAFN